MKRRVGWWRRIVCVPLGFAWLGVIALLAVPVVLVMTSLYYLVQGTRALRPHRKTGEPQP